MRPEPSTHTLIIGLFGTSFDRRSLLVYLRAYLDESGTHDAPFIVLGGVVASAFKWNRFDKRYMKRLRRDGIDIIHAKDLRKRKDPKSERLKVDSLAIVAKTVSFGLTARLDLADFDEAYRSGDKPRKEQLDSAYGFTFRYWLTKACELAAEAYEGRQLPELSVILEDGHRNRGGPIKIFHELKDAGRMPIPLGYCVLGPKRLPGLQAADVVTHLSYRNEHYGESLLEDAEPMATLMTQKAEHTNRGEPGPILRMHLSRAFLAAAKQELLERDAFRATGREAGE